MDDSKQKKRQFFLRVLALGIVAVYAIFQVDSFLKEGTQAGADLREAQKIESLELLWSSNLRIDRTPYGGCTNKYHLIFTRLDVQNNQVIVPVWNGDIPLMTRVYLTGLELETGQIKWRTLLNTTQYAIGSNSSKVIVVEADHEPPSASCSPELSYCEAVKIVSYDVLTGEEDWSTLQSNMSDAGSLCVNDEIVSIVGAATRSTYQEKLSLVANTGEKIPFQDLRIDDESSDLKLNWHIVNQLGIEDGDIRGQFVVEGKFLYFLTSHNKSLWIVNRETLEIAGKVEFDGNALESGNYFNQYKITTENDFVVVYLGDSQQIFVFKWRE